MELLIRRLAGWEQPYFKLESFSVEVNHRSGVVVTETNGLDGDTSNAAPTITDEDSNLMLDSDATVKLWVGNQRIVTHGEGNGPVDALHNALVSAIGDHYPGSQSVHLTDYKVRVLDTARATKAITRVLIDSTDGFKTWTTIGVSENIVEASWQALADSIIWGLLHMKTDQGASSAGD